MTPIVERSTTLLLHLWKRLNPDWDLSIVIDEKNVRVGKRRRKVDYAY